MRQRDMLDEEATHYIVALATVQRIVLDIGANVALKLAVACQMAFGASNAGSHVALFRLQALE